MQRGAWEHSGSAKELVQSTSRTYMETSVCRFIYSSYGEKPVSLRGTQSVWEERTIVIYFEKSKPKFVQTDFQAGPSDQINLPQPKALHQPSDLLSSPRWSRKGELDRLPCLPECLWEGGCLTARGGLEGSDKMLRRYPPKASEAKSHQEPFSTGSRSIT